MPDVRADLGDTITVYDGNRLVLIVEPKIVFRGVADLPDELTVDVNSPYVGRYDVSVTNNGAITHCEEEY